MTQKGGTACLRLLEKLLQIQAGSKLVKVAAAANLHPALLLSTSRTVQVCARCCLRFAGVSGDIYAPPAPSIRDLQAAVSDAHGDAQAGKSRYIGKARGDIHVTGHLCKCAIKPPLCALWRHACKALIMGLWEQMEQQPGLRQRHILAHCVWERCSAQMEARFLLPAATYQQQCSTRAAALSRGSL